MATVIQNPIILDPLSHKLVCWDVDPTGRFLVDEICQLATYTPSSNFSQYIMPHRDVNEISRNKHKITTISVGVYRILKENKLRGRVLKTKSELFALKDFINWLESIKGTQAIVLVAYERNKLAPYLLIEGLKRYNLLERFCKCVAGFANAYQFIKKKCELSMSSFSLRNLAKILLNKEKAEVSGAHSRAKLCYEILDHLCTGEFEDDPCPSLRAVQSCFNTVSMEDKEIESLKKTLLLQKTLKPIFWSYLRDTTTRKLAVTLRQYLTGAQISLEDLKQMWELHETSDKFKKFLGEKLQISEENHMDDLTKMIENYFNKGSHNRGSFKRNIKRNKKTEKTAVSLHNSAETEKNVDIVSENLNS